MTVKIGQTYTTAERAQQQPPACPNCGTNEFVEVEWRDSTFGYGPERRWTPISVRCQACAVEVDRRATDD